MFSVGILLDKLENVFLYYYCTIKSNIEKNNRNVFERLLRVIIVVLMRNEKQQNNKAKNNSINSQFVFPNSILVCFDVTDKDSFTHVDRWFAEISRYACENVNGIYVVLKKIIV